MALLSAIPQQGEAPQEEETTDVGGGGTAEGAHRPARGAAMLGAAARRTIELGASVCCRKLLQHQVN